MITETSDSQMPHVTLIQTGVCWNRYQPIDSGIFIIFIFIDVIDSVGINLVAEIPPKECNERVVCCDGGDPHLGHPKVYINLVSVRLKVRVE